MLKITSIDREVTCTASPVTVAVFDVITRMLKAMFAGIAIGVGALAYLSVDDKVLGSLLFSIGLFIVCSFNLTLFTGRTCYVLADDAPANGDLAFRLNYICNVIKKSLSLISVWIGNFLGTFLICGGLNEIRNFDNLSAKATAMWDIKVHDSTSSLLMLGAICNVLIFFGVENYKRNKSDIGKYLGIILSVMVFILIGSEHCVADMAYLWFVEGVTEDHFSALLTITAGNIIGGVSIGALSEAIKNWEGVH